MYNAEEIEQDLSAKVIFTVPKRAFKKAVDRNFIRRRMKESYRLFKNDFYPQLPNLKLSLCIIYIAKEKNEFQFIDKKMKLALQKLADELNKK